MTSNAVTLISRAGERLDTLLRPACCVIYARGAVGFAPVFSSGTAVTPDFEPGSPLLESLAGRVRAVDLERGRNLDQLGASPADRAALETLAVSVLLPVSRSHNLAAFAVLGRKRSGDTYTATDITLLGTVAASVSISLERVSDRRLLSEARRMQEKLRQYVPGSIAVEITRGRELEAGERDVSVLFADLRDYTSMSEQRRPEEVFSTVSRYTEAVSRVVVAHGGTVVEFNGDGMMAVFGAPDPLPGKEERALDAARGIVAEVRALDEDAGAAGTQCLRVGVGVATGEAYVGSIRTVDRHIWSAIGNTTNLAARLQALTKDLGSSIVIDETTWRAAGAPSEGFERHIDTVIRGLRELHDVFAVSETFVPRAA